MSTLLWFQRDLRVNDNPALNWALQQDQPVVAVYVHSPAEEAPWAPGAASRWWLYHSLKSLSKDLLQRNIDLQYFHADSADLIPRLAGDLAVESVVWTDRHEPRRIEHEAALEERLQKNGITVRRFKDELLKNPDEFLTASKNTPYKVFTPFYTRLRRELCIADTHLNEATPSNSCRTRASVHVDALSLEQLQLIDDHPWHHKLCQHWTPGEASALDTLERFANERLDRYSTQRDVPASNGTSNLSPHLHFGEVSPRQVVSAIAPLIEFQGGDAANAAEAFLRQVIWREFARYVIRHFPNSATEPMNSKFSQSFWTTDETRLNQWERGNTGIPIIDAGMRQLWDTGWMHNRVRMLVASILTKNLGIAWQEGARWFWDTLVDADLANNTMGWQWVAGCGVDAAPYFRIFNPQNQAKRFDRDRIYIKRWLPQEPDKVTQEPGIDLAASRSVALDRYNRLVRGRKPELKGSPL